ncbi:proteobacterial dedicated sortase system response regulator [Solemya velesiana gill symbiont]|uniref:Proteobacterial dedicated sortase system response regulator n=1 Tax=Solemya velesiana gill symbiont TaxID=1918948 RepID=A0A1T2KVK3_9GAMM|nr:proteobacterial dedicated sortase system response regulator [Solemya velesiana gill symbiont]OOZ36893.1 proteobacterial dedicated sortase system response regulator [Solemya velesiana gill symbiont]
MSKQIAIVEDEPAILANYTDALTRQGYQVNGYSNRDEGLGAFRIRLPDLVVLDIGLGDDVDGGFELCRELRAMSVTLPIIFLTARDSDLDTVSGLRLGADDYLTKDISLAHLTARIAALFHRLEVMQQPVAQEKIIERGPLRIDMDRLQVTWRDNPVELTVTELWFVHALANHPCHVRSREQLMEAANILVDSTSISTHVKRIRRKFEQIDPDFDAIETVYGMGYRWKV